MSFDHEDAEAWLYEKYNRLGKKPTDTDVSHFIGLVAEEIGAGTQYETARIHALVEVMQR